MKQPLDTNLAKELHELRQTIVGTRKGQIVCPHCESYGTTNDNSSPILFPVSSSNEEEGGRDDNLRENYTSNEISGNSSLSLQSNVLLAQTNAWNVEFNPDTKVALQLNLVHKLTQNTGTKTYAAFSMDEKYLASVSSTGILRVFDVKTGKRLM